MDLFETAISQGIAPAVVVAIYLIVIKIIDTKKLPDLIDSYVLGSLDKLFTNIEEISLTSDKIEEILFCDSETLTYTEFLEKLENLKRFVSYEKEKENLRIKKGIK